MKYNEYNGIRVGQKVFVIEQYEIHDAVVEEIYDDVVDDNCDHICKWAKTSRGYDHLSDVFLTYDIAKRAVSLKKLSYDEYVLRGY
jgi:hypothetical protein